MAAKESPVTVIATCEGAPLPVAIVGTVTMDFPGPALLLAGAATSTPGVAQTLVSAVVPGGKTWRIRRVEVVSRAHATFSARIDGTEFESGKTNPATPTVALDLPVWVGAAAGQLVELLYEQTNAPAVPVECRIHYTDT